MNSIRVIVVSNYMIHRDFKSYPLLQPIEIVERYHTLHDLQHVGEVSHDVLVIDLDWIALSSLEMINEFSLRSHKTRVIMISRRWTGEQVQALVSQGVSGILLRHTVKYNLEHYIRAVNGGRMVISPSLLNMFLTSIPKHH